jgi:hypothetical protein
MSGTQATAADLEARELRFFTPFQSLPDEQLIPLAGLLQLEVIQEGTRLQALGDPYRYFLLSGVIELQAQDGMRQIIESGSEKARTALIAEGDSTPDDLVALSRVRLLKVGRICWRNWAGQRSPTPPMKRATPTPCGKTISIRPSGRNCVRTGWSSPACRKSRSASKRPSKAKARISAGSPASSAPIPPSPPS